MKSGPDTDEDAALHWVYEVSRMPEFRGKNVNLKGVRPSTNFEDRTGYTETQKRMQKLFALLNPVSAYRKTRDAFGLNFKNPPSKNFEDRRGQKVDWVELMGREGLTNQGIDPDEGLRGLPAERIRQILFDKAMDEFGVSTMQDYSRLKSRRPMIGPTEDRLLRKKK